MSPEIKPTFSSRICRVSLSEDGTVHILIREYHYTGRDPAQDALADIFVMDDLTAISRKVR